MFDGFAMIVVEEDGVTMRLFVFHLRCHCSPVISRHYFIICRLLSYAIPTFIIIVIHYFMLLPLFFSFMFIASHFARRLFII